MTFQQKAIVRAFRHSAYAIGCIAQGDDAAKLHQAAAQKYADVALAAQSAVKRAHTPWLVQALLDAHPWDDDLSTSSSGLIS